MASCKATAGHGFPDIRNTPAETVMMPEIALQGSVDEESRHFLGSLLQGFIGVRRIRCPVINLSPPPGPASG